MHNSTTEREEEDNDSKMLFNLEIMYRNAVSLSRGTLVDITIGRFGTDDLLYYTADSARHLRRLRLQCCRLCILESILIAVARKLPLLEELEITNCYHFLPMELALKAIGRCCPLLKSLKLNKKTYPYAKFDGDAFAIAQSHKPCLRYAISSFSETG
ncbi:hypothetical protein RIF29_42235 [Crotalaria pallida]|uniref:Uncharacterized protein n=1 Tax=Crotalaria pallida TaxID=3830 RepID=A0AAN9E6J6_CROPI